MVRPALRSRGVRRVYRRTPGGRTVIHYDRLRKAKARCAICGRELGGVPIDAMELRKLPKSLKRPERMFGGVLCPSCLSLALKMAVRESFASK